jgi:hypothetical protein
MTNNFEHEISIHLKMEEHQGIQLLRSITAITTEIIMCTQENNIKKENYMNLKKRLYQEKEQKKKH